MTSPEEPNSARVRQFVTRLFAFCIGGLCLWYVFESYNWKEVGQLLLAADVSRFAIGAPVAIGGLWLARSTRWYLLLSDLPDHPTWSRVYAATAVSMAVANFTPGQSGEALKVEILKRFSPLDRVDGYGTFFVERVLDGYVLVSLTLIGPLLGFDLLSTTATWTLGGVLIACSAIGLVVLYSASFRGKLGEFQMRIRESVGNPRRFAGVIGLTILGWGCVVALWLTTLTSVGLDIGVLQTLGYTAALTVVNVLSLVPGAIGVSEAAGAELLMQLGHSEPLAQAGALGLRISSVLALVLGLLHLPWTRTPTRS